MRSSSPFCAMHAMRPNGSAVTSKQIGGLGETTLRDKVCSNSPHIALLAAMRASIQAV